MKDNSKLKELQCQYNNLEKQHGKVLERLESAKQKLQTYKSASTTLQRSESLNKTNLSKIKGQNEQLEKELEESKVYIRKLEHRISKGGHYFADLNLQLQNKVNKLQEEKEEQSSFIQSLEREIQDLKEEIESLSSALQMKAEELGVDHNLLFEVTSLKQKCKTQSKQLIELTQALNKTQESLETALIKVEELEFIKESNNTDLEKLESHSYKLNQNLLQIQKDNQNLYEERKSMAEYIEQMKENERQYERDLQYFSEESEKINQQFNLEIANKQKEIDRLNRIKDELFDKLKAQESQINSHILIEETLKQELCSLKQSSKTDVWELIASEKKRNEDLLREILKY